MRLNYNGNFDGNDKWIIQYRNNVIKYTVYRKENKFWKM